METITTTLFQNWQQDVIDLCWIAGAMLLAAILGYERETQHKPAGIRTHIIVAASAALFVSFGDPLMEQFSREGNSEALQSDPLRIIEAVITGVSFLGAGTIFRRGSEDVIEGLTTAASLLLSAGIGICMAINRPVLAVGVAALGWVALKPLQKVNEQQAKG